jgi:FKBP-type peptidyl-prolyl cis-trans isomerase SlyD
LKITRGTTVSFHYELLDAQGEEVENTRDDEPVRYRHGDEEILPGLEEALAGHAAGDRFRVTLSPHDAYGDYNPDGLVSIPRGEVQEADQEIVPGDWIVVSVTDADDEDEEGELDMRVVEVHDEELILDANHPLAGQRVTFVVEVLEVAAADS